VIIKIERPGMETPETAAKHSSEAGIPMNLIDGLVMNDSDICSLTWKVNTNWVPLLLSTEGDLSKKVKDISEQAMEV
jgi:hypothetical protein